MKRTDKISRTLGSVAFILFVILSVQVSCADSEEMIIFAARHYLPKGVSHFRMWQASPDGARKRQIQWPPGVPFFAVPSPSGHRFVYAPVWAPTLPTYFQEATDFLNGADPKDSALWIVNADGKGKRKISEKAPGGICWLGSERELLLVHEKERPPVILDVQTLRSEAVEGVVQSPTSNPFGFHRDLQFGPPVAHLLGRRDSDYWRIHLPTRNRVRLPVFPEAAFSGGHDRDEVLLSSKFSPDGRMLAFVGEDGDKAILKSVDVETGAVKSLLEYDGLINHFEWSPQGSHLLAECYWGLSGGPHSDLFVVNLNTGENRLIEEITASTAHWSPSGSSVVYKTTLGARPFGRIHVWSADIGVVKADGTGNIYLTSGAVYATLPRWINTTKRK